VIFVFCLIENTFKLIIIKGTVPQLEKYQLTKGLAAELLTEVGLIL